MEFASEADVVEYYRRLKVVADINASLAPYRESSSERPVQQRSVNDDNVV